jgi:hypothetical protein
MLLTCILIHFAALFAFVAHSRREIRANGARRSRRTALHILNPKLLRRA